MSIPQNTASISINNPKNLDGRFQNDSYLNRRGVAQAAARMNWYFRSWYDGTAGYGVPIADAGGGRHRWRAADNPLPDGGKTRWLGKSGIYTPKYYCHQSIAQAVAAAGGKLVIAAGEMDLLTFVEIGWLNVVAFTSEGSVPPDLADQLQAWGVKHVDYWLDTDTAGLKSGRKVQDALENSGITFNPLSLEHCNLGQGSDVNDLWQAIQFDRDRLIEALGKADLAALPESKKKYSRSDNQPTVRLTGSYAEKLASEQLDKKIAEIRSTRKGSRNRTLYDAAWYLFGMALSGDWPGIDDATVERECMAAGRSIGLEDSEIESALRSARNTCKTMPCELPVAIPSGKRGDLGNAPEDLPTNFTADATFNRRYVEAGDLKASTTALRSPLGTGKTQATIDLVQNAGRVLVLSHLEALTGNIAGRFQRAGIDVTLYTDVPSNITPSLAAFDKLVCSLNSLHRLEGAAPFDVVFIDEIEQALKHIWGGTMTGPEAARAFEMLKMVVQNAGRVVVADAHLTDVSVAWLRSIRPDVTTVENTYRHNWGELGMFQSEAALMAAATACIEASPDKPTVITTGSRRAARKYTRMYSELYPGKVLTIHGHNTHKREIREIINHLDERLNEYRVVIVSPSVGTGVDIQTPVAGVFGYFPGDHLLPSDMLQQMARYRNANRRGVFIPYAERHKLATSAKDLLQHLRGKTARTAQLADFHLHGISAATATQGEITRLWAAFKAAGNRQLVNVVNTFMVLASREGFQVARIEDEADHMAQVLKAAREQLKADDTRQILTGDAVTPDDIDALRITGDLDEKHYLGLERWKVEHATGQTIDETLLEDYRTSRQRSQLRRFADWLQGVEAAKAKDRAEVENLPFDRRHNTVHLVLFEKMVAAVFGPAGLESDERIPADELERRMTGFIEDHLADIQHVLDGGRTDMSEAPIAVFRRMLKRFDLYLCSTVGQRDENGSRRRVYWLDKDRLTLIQERAKRRIAYREGLVQNVGKHIHSHVLYQKMPSEQKPSALPSFLPPLTPERAHREAQIQF